jgi:hypothetical protein
MIVAKVTASNSVASFFMGLNPPGAELSQRAREALQSPEKGSENGPEQERGVARKISAE